MADRVESGTPWLILRILVGLPFIGSGIFNALNWSASTHYNAMLTGAALAPVFTVLAVSQIVGGLSLVTGYRPRIGAALLLAFLVPATIRHLVIALDVTTFGTGDVGMLQLAKRGMLSSVEKNIGLMGVMIFVLLRGLGPTRDSAATPA